LLWSRVSKALDRARNIIPVSNPLSILWSNLLVVLMRHVLVECSGRKLDWQAVNSWFPGVIEPLTVLRIDLIITKYQPRTQALSTTRLAGGKTLVQAGHVSPRFWEITKFLHKGGGLSFILPI
jgi:hypothetical protein